MIREIVKQHKSIRRKPINLAIEDEALFAHEFEKKIRSAHVLELRNVYILNNTVFDLRKLRFYSGYTHISGLSKKSMLKNIVLLAQRPITIENAVWIIDSWSTVYFHWLTDALPRLMLSKSLMTNQQVILPAHYKEFSFIADSLAWLGINAVYYDANACIKVKHLLLPSHTAKPGNYNKEIINEVRNSFLKPDTKIPSGKIYISRKNASKRKIKNEDDVEKLLSGYGFEIHNFEEYDFSKQVKIMSGAKILAGPHGAGLTNMIFMKKGGKVFELRKDDDAENNCYFSLASDLGLDYFYQLNPGDSTDAHTSDITVDLPMLKKNLELILA